MNPNQPNQQLQVQNAQNLSQQESSQRTIFNIPPLIILKPTTEGHNDVETNLMVPGLVLQGAQNVMNEESCLKKGPIMNEGDFFGSVIYLENLLDTNKSK